MTLSHLIKLAGAAVATLAFSASASAGCNSGPYCNSGTSQVLPSLSSYSFQSSAMSYATPPQQVVPFTTTTSNISNVRLAGLGPNERLCPTKCPVNVYNPNQGKVLGCYNVCKVAPTYTPVTVQSWVRVVRPVIYVRYPVPTPVPVPVAPVCAPMVSYCGY